MALNDFWKRFFPQGNTDQTKTISSPIVPSDTDGADEVRESSENDFYGLDSYVRQFVPEISSTRDLVNTYRQMEEIQEVNLGIQEIVDQAVVNGRGDDAVSLDLEDTEFSKAIQEKIENTFEKVLRLYNFRIKGGEVFRRWYVDSRSHYFMLMDPKNPKAGIQEIRYLDPRRIKKVREYETEMVDQQKIIKGYRDFYEYRPSEIDKNKWAGTSGVTFNSNGQVVIPAEHVAFAHSNKFDYNGNMIGYLHQSIKPANQLKLIEDHIVIYRVSRAPERRVFYIDIGNTPRSKATEYVNQVKNGMKRKMTYDSVTGKIESKSDSHSIMEDYWLPRKNGKNTEVTTLPGGQNLGEINDLEYFKDELYESLNIPKTRYQEQSGMLGSRETEISRDELRFHKFVRRLRDKFSPILLHALEFELIATNVLTQKEWDTEFEKIHLVFREDSYFQELVDAEILSQRLGMLRDLRDYVGTYFSHQYIQENVLMMSKEQIKEIREQNEAEAKDEFWNKADDDGF